VRAVVLLAGMGSRLGSLTASTPKSLLPIGACTTLDRMVASLGRVGVDRVVLVCGHLQAAIEQHLSEAPPTVEVVILRNEDYRTTNTGHSLLLAREELEGETFVKLDGDVVFGDEILVRLAAAPSGWSHVCVDRSDVDDEVVKVQCDDAGRVLRIGNRLPVATAAGESIGIERIDASSTTALFAELEAMAADDAHRQSYYEVAYDAIVRAGAPFRALDVTGLAWVEIDTLADYEAARRLFPA
jgi:L-glutamine-phosphate cytidylyltransferase